MFLGYLDYFRGRIIDKVAALDAAEQRRSHLPSGWRPLRLVKHLTFVETRWLEWGFAGRSMEDPWGDHRDDRWYVAPTETAGVLVSALLEQAERSRTIIEANDLSAVGQPGPRWDGAEPATLERVLFHLVQEYARHLGHLDKRRPSWDQKALAGCWRPGIGVSLPTSTAPPSRMIGLPLASRTASSTVSASMIV